MSQGRALAWLLALGVTAALACGVFLGPLQVGYAALVIAVVGVCSGLGLILRGQALEFSWLFCLAPVALGYFWWRAETSPSPGFTLMDQFLVLLAGGVTLLVLTFGARGGNDFGKALLICVGVLVAANVGVSFFQRFGDSGYTIWGDGGHATNRARGFFTHQNHLASLLSGAFCYALTSVLIGTRPLAKWTGGVVALLCLVGVLFTESRGGSIVIFGGAVAVLICAISWSAYNKSPQTSKLIVVGALLLIGGLIGASFVFQHLESVRGQGLTETGFRLSALKLAASYVGESPVIGNGARSFEWFAAQNWGGEGLTYLESFPRFVHNEPVQVLFDYGIVGLGLVGALLAWSIVRGFLKSLDSKEPPVLFIGALCALITFVGQSLFSFIGHIPSLLVFAAVHVGLLLRVEAEDPRNRKARAGTAARIRLLMRIDASRPRMASMAAPISPNQATAQGWASDRSTPG